MRKTDNYYSGNEKQRAEDIQRGLTRTSEPCPTPPYIIRARQRGTLSPNRLRIERLKP